MTPATLIATAARYERHYGCRKGDGGTADQLRAGAEAMVECERLRAALVEISVKGRTTGHSRVAMAYIADAALQGDPK
jgi:hypothetical protein